jgi:F-type H+-transporting ATPase subunit epsilon
MPAKLKLEIVTPDALVYSQEVDLVTLPGAQGEMGIYPQHVPLMTQLVAGEISVLRDGHTDFLAVGDGFVEITGEKVAVMTDMAIKADDIDEAKAEQARHNAEARLAEVVDREEAATVEAALARSLAQLKVKRRHRTGP